jgi:hypothetical protein
MYGGEILALRYATNIFPTLEHYRHHAHHWACLRISKSPDNWMASYLYRGVKVNSLFLGGLQPPQSHHMHYALAQRAVSI